MSYMSKSFGGRMVKPGNGELRIPPLTFHDSHSCYMDNGLNEHLGLWSHSSDPTLYQTLANKQPGLTVLPLSPAMVPSPQGIGVSEEPAHMIEASDVEGEEGDKESEDHEG